MFEIHDILFYNQTTDLEKRMECNFILSKDYYVLAFTTTKPDLTIYSMPQYTLFNIIVHDINAV